MTEFEKQLLQCRAQRDPLQKVIDHLNQGWVMMSPEGLDTTEEFKTMLLERLADKQIAELDDKSP
jgi:hypothetical protein